MKKVLIISPHYPPSNLAAVHRSRLFAQHLPSFEWEPVILTVHEKYYEEKLDWNLYKLLPSGQRIEKVKAFTVTKPRVIGDIGLRAFFQLYKKARTIIKEEKIDFLYIPVPSFYAALLGRALHRSTGIKYGIDYIDPWVHYFPGSEKKFSRHWFSAQLAKFLEPIAVKKASLITGVAEGYYKGVIERTPHLNKTCLFGAMPYGGDKRDHEEVLKLDVTSYLFPPKSNKIRLVYAGAMLPKAYSPLENIFRSIAANPSLFNDVEFHFIGTGKRVDDPTSYNIRSLADKYGLWETVVFEYPQRIPYLDVLVHLKNADAVFILGSTEPHYTPSKVYQAVLSEKPVLAVLHTESSAVAVIQQSKAGIVLAFKGEEELEKIYTTFVDTYTGFKNFAQTFIPSTVDQHVFERYSAKETTKQLVALFNQLT
jgi:hypothetical protein